MDKWKFHIHWERKNYKHRGRVPGLYSYSEAKRIVKIMRATEPSNHYWINTLKHESNDKRFATVSEDLQIIKATIE